MATIVQHESIELCTLETSTLLSVKYKRGSVEGQIKIYFIWLGRAEEGMALLRAVA